MSDTSRSFGPDSEYALRLVRYLDKREDQLLEMTREISRHYRRYTVPKKRGKVRWIEAPEPELKAVQRELLTTLFYQFPVHDAAHGFVPHRFVEFLRNPCNAVWTVSF